MANIWNSTSNTIVRGTSDADTICNEGFTTVTIAAGAGNDSFGTWEQVRLGFSAKRETILFTAAGVAIILRSTVVTATIPLQ